VAAADGVSFLPPPLQKTPSVTSPGKILGVDGGKTFLILRKRKNDPWNTRRKFQFSAIEKQAARDAIVETRNETGPWGS